MDEPSELRAFVAAHATAEFVISGADGYPLATLLPILWRGDTVIAHMARANPQWRALSGPTPALLVCGGPQAYISPTWYAAKREHGRVVPTWNYSAVHLTGTAVLHDDPSWVRAAVTALTEHHEGGRPAPWAVADAPAPYLDGQLRAIVGIEVHIERVEGKAKLSQNRSDADRAGVVEGLRGEATPGAQAVADAMADDLSASPLD